MRRYTVLIIVLFSMVFSIFAQIIPIDEKTVKVTVLGRGRNVEDAKHDAMRNAVDLVVSDMLTMQDEMMKYQQNKDVILGDADKYMVGDYVFKGKTTKKGVYRGKKYKVTIKLELKINKEMLRKDLEMAGVIKSSKDLRKQLDNFSIMPYVDEKKSSPVFVAKKDLVYAKISSYLQNQHIPTIGEEEIKKIEQNEEIINLEKSSAADNGEEDLMLQMARNTNADFYIKVVGHVEEAVTEGMRAIKVSVSIGAYTVMTGEHIADQTGYSKPLSLSSKDASISAGIEEAINSAMDDIMNKLRLFWKDYVADGRPYKLVFYDYKFSELAKIRRVLKQMTNRVKLGRKAGNVASFIIWYKGQIDDLLFEIPGRIELNLKEDPVVLGNTIRFFRKVDE